MTLCLTELSPWDFGRSRYAGGAGVGKRDPYFGKQLAYISISDKMRVLAQEFRSPVCASSRRAIIAAQMTIFVKRMKLVAWAERVLYVAVACFIATAMVISATLWRKMLESVTVPLFAFGIYLS